ncbi:MAG: hypothetical protein KF914_12520 [Rhizobiaceae bacterium]|nr:hypothetical protein [Rhizobiaceae bacterium]
MALILSATSFYFSNLRVVDHALMRIVDYEKGSIAVDPGGPGFVTVKTVFANPGNRPAIVLGVTYQYAGRRDLDQGGFGGPVGVADGLFPLIVAPRDLKVVELNVPIAVAGGHFDEGAPDRSDSAARQFYFGFQIESIDSAGVKHFVWSGMVGSLVVGPDRLWRSLGSIDGEQDRPPIQLFE